MLQDAGNGGNVPYGYTQGFGTPGGVQNNINGYQIGGPAPAQRGQRPRSRSNVGMQQPQQYQTAAPATAGSIPGWAMGVQAAQASDNSQPPVNTQNYQAYQSAPLQTLGSMSVPQDPGPRPNINDLNLTKKQGKKVLENWQRAYDEWAQYQEQQRKQEAKSHARSRSQTRFAQESGVNPSGYPVNSVPYPTADPASDLEQKMGRLSMGALRPQGIQNNAAAAAAARQAERGRRLSGGALGLSGSEAAIARERSRSRQPYDRERPISGDYGSGRPAYMPTGRGTHNMPSVDPGLQHVTQPGVVPRVANINQYPQASSHTPAVNPYGLPPQPSPIMHGQQIHPQMTGGQYVPQPSPIMHGQQIPQVTGGQFAPQPSPQYVPMTMMNGTITNAIPVGHISSFPQAAALVQTPMHGAQPTLDLNNLPPSVVYGGGISPGGFNMGGMGGNPQTGAYPATTPTTGMYSLPYQMEAQGPPRRKGNINDVKNPQYVHAQHKPNTLLDTTTAPPRHLNTSNISRYTSTQQSVQPPVQPTAHTHQKSHSVSGYVTAAPREAISPVDTASSGSSRGGATSSYNAMNSYQTYSGGTARPPLHQNDSVGLSQPTGPSGFGTRPHHVKHPSYQGQLRSPPESQGSPSSNSDIPRVSRRPPGPNAIYKPFSPQVITYDLNGEGRQPDPLRFGRFIYDRDVSHEEWELFRSQILEKWAARDPGYNRYHSAVKRVAAILSAWNFAFFNPRGMDLVLFKGNERRSGAHFGQPESQLEFLTEAAPVSGSDSEESEEESDEEDVSLQNWVGPQADAYRQQREREKTARAAYKQSLKQRAPKQLESPHSLVVYPLALRNGGESYR